MASSICRSRITVLVVAKATPNNLRDTLFPLGELRHLSKSLAEAMDEETRFWEIVFCFAREAGGGGCRCLIRGTAEIPYCRWLIELISEFFFFL